VNEIDDLLRRAQRIADTGERLSASFAAELAAVFRDAERALVRLLGALDGDVSVRAVQAIALRDALRRILDEAGYDRLMAVSSSSVAERMANAVLSGRGKAAAAVLDRSEATIEALRRLAAFDLFQQGDEVATALWRSLAQQLFTGRDRADILADLADALDREVRSVQTLFDTLVSMFGRQVEAVHAEDLPENQPFLFAGPIDSRTRPFCLARVGKVFTRAAIDAMDNGQLGNVFLTGGGYNCRHSFLAVESRELRDIVESGERIPEVADDVRRVEELKKRKAA
jgi:hypothetical protein